MINTKSLNDTQVKQPIAEDPARILTLDELKTFNVQHPNLEEKEKDKVSTP